MPIMPRHGCGASIAVLAPQGNPFTFNYSGTIDSSALETIPLAPPFPDIRPLLTMELDFTLSSAAYRDTTGGLGVQILDQTTGFGLDFQCSVGPSPDHIYITFYSEWTPADPDVHVVRTDYVMEWPLGTTFAMRLVVEPGLIPHFFIDDVEQVLAGPFVDEAFLVPGDTAIIYGYSFVPGNTVAVTDFTLSKP